MAHTVPRSPHGDQCPVPSAHCRRGTVGLQVGGLGTARIVTGEPVTIPILMMVAGPIMFGLQYLHPVVDGLT
jgi:hypothetical protein